MNYILSLGLTVATTANVPRTAYLQESVEWLCARADEVVVGTLVSAEDLQGSGKSRGLMYIQVQGQSLGAAGHPRTFSIGIRDVSLADLNALLNSKTQLVFFLRRTIQAFSFENTSVSLWPLRTTASGHWVHPLGLESPLISAHGQLISDMVSLEKSCTAAMRPPDVSSYPEPPKAFLPTPAPVTQSLGTEQAPPYLIVPAANFPEASSDRPAHSSDQSD